MTPRSRIISLHAAVLAATLAFAGALSARAADITSDRFAPGWESRAKPLFYQGEGLNPGDSRWYVPANLPRGHYVLVNRTRDKATLIDGHAFEINGDVTRDLYMMVPAGYDDVVAVRAEDVPNERQATAR